MYINSKISKDQIISSHIISILGVDNPKTVLMNCQKYYGATLSDTLSDKNLAYATFVRSE